MVKAIETAAAKLSITSMVTVGLSSFSSLSKEMDESTDLAGFFIADGLAGPGFRVGFRGICGAGLASAFVTGSASVCGARFASGFVDVVAPDAGVVPTLGFTGAIPGFEGALT